MAEARRGASPSVLLCSWGSFLLVAGEKTRDPGKVECVQGRDLSCMSAGLDGLCLFTCVCMYVGICVLCWFFFLYIYAEDFCVFCIILFLRPSAFTIKSYACVSVCMYVSIYLPFCLPTCFYISMYVPMYVCSTFTPGAQ